MQSLIASIESGAKPSMRDFLAAAGDRIPLLHELAETPQDPAWHAEGDVLTHTEMVLDALYTSLSKEAAHITGWRRTALILAAALHDIAKPLATCRREIRGVWRTVAPYHETRGRSLLAPLLYGQLSYPAYEAVLGLVGHHIDAKRLVIKGRPRGDFLRLARLVDPELLYLLELADMRGRLCGDRSSQIEYIELYGLGAKEHGAFCRFGSEAPAWRQFFATELAEQTPACRDRNHAQFIADLEAGRVNMPEEGLARGYRFRQGFPELVMLVGPSGAGKTSWARTQLADHMKIELDSIRGELGHRASQRENAKVLHLARERLREGLRDRAKIVWDATNLRRDFRRQLCQLAHDYGALVTFVCFHNSSEGYAQGNRNRAHAVPCSILTKQLASMDWPSLDEADRTIALDHTYRPTAAFGFVDSALPYGLGMKQENVHEAGPFS